MPDVAALVIRVLAVICLGLAVPIFAVRSKQVVYPVALVLVGLLVAITPYELGIRLSRDIIMIGLLPIILFQGPPNSTSTSSVRTRSRRSCW